MRSYANLKLKDFIDIQRIPKEWEQEDKDIETLSRLTGKHPDFYEQMNFKQLTEELKTIAFLRAGFPTKVHKTIWVKGKRYRAKLHPESYSTKSYLAFKAHGVDAIGNIHKILSWIYRPAPFLPRFIVKAIRVFKPSFLKFDPDKSAEVFINHANVSQVYGTFFLFSKLLKRQKVVMEFSILESNQVLTEFMKDLATIQYKDIMDGTTPSTN